MPFEVTETPQSSNIERVAYDRDAQIVRVAFRRKDGVALWEYFPVSEADYERILQADSIGSAVNMFLVKGPYQGRRVSE